MRYTCLFDNFDKNKEYFKKGGKIEQKFFLASFDIFFYKFGPFLHITFNLKFILIIEEA